MSGDPISPLVRMRGCAREGCDVMYEDPHGGRWPRKFCSIQCYQWVKRGPATCIGCGAKIPPGWPSKPRKSCGKPECVSEAHAAPKRGRTMPVASIEAGRAKIVARQAARNADITTPLKQVCARPGCTNLLAGQARIYCSPTCHYEDRAYRHGSKRAQPYHRCQNCRQVFAFDGNGKGVFCSAQCSATGDRSQTRAADVVRLEPLRGHRRADWQAVTADACAGCQSRTRLVRHHVVFEQHVIREGGDRWDPRNAMVVCWACHMDLHATWDFPLPKLPDSALTFAAELLGGARAFDYLRRRYGGSDTRLAALIPTLRRMTERQP